MHNKSGKIIRAVVNTLATAFFFNCLLVIILYLTLGNTLDKYKTKINKYGISYANNTKVIQASFDAVEKRIKKRPQYGSVFAKLKIPKIDLSLDVYHGDTMTILGYNQVGHHGQSYFPGETGTVLFAGHNGQGIFARLPELVVGDLITVEATYGKFNYKVTNFEIVSENELRKMPLSYEGERLVLYTCYPIPNYGYTSQRYVVYAERVGDNNE